MAIWQKQFCGVSRWDQEVARFFVESIADVLDFQVRSQGIKYSQLGIETKTFAYVISTSRDTSQATYTAMTKIFPIRSGDYTVGFVGYQAQNFAVTQDMDVNQYYVQQKWLTTKQAQDKIDGRVPGH